MQYRKLNDTAWTKHTHTHTAATITGLHTNTHYQIRIKATKNNTHSTWTTKTAIPIQNTTIITKCYTHTNNKCNASTSQAAHKTHPLREQACVRS